VNGVGLVGRALPLKISIRILLMFEKRHTFFPFTDATDVFSASASLSFSTTARFRFAMFLRGCGTSTSGLTTSSHARALAANCGFTAFDTLVKARSGACRLPTRAPRVEGAMVT
jgi:hypothetical protein